MDGMLSQDEINALLNGMDLSSDEEGESNEAGAENTEASGSAPSEGSSAPKLDTSGILTDVEKDAIGEVANISMGSSATTLYSLVNRKVNITTPVVDVVTWDNIMADYERPCVFIQIKYTMGLDGTNILVLKEHDVKVITDLMMGGDGTNTEGELGELHLSAISEAMNQMMGSAATSLSTMLKTTIDISPPEATLLDLTKVKTAQEVSPFLGDAFVKISFRMQIDDLVDSSIMQLYPIDFARKLVDTFIKTQAGNIDIEPEQTAAPTQPQQQASAPAQAPVQNQGMQAAPQMNMGQADANAMYGGMNPQMMGMNPQMMNMNPQMMGMNPQMMNMNPQMMGVNPMPMQNVNVQPAQFQSFTTGTPNVPGGENIGLIMDVPLEVTVELGRTTKSISEILDFAPGTIIELDRIAGEPIDVLVNGKFVAKGEVVVIEESFGVRVTEIIK